VKVQRAFISWFDEICNEGQVVVALRYAKQNKYEFVKDYYDRFLWLCIVIPQQPHDIYFKKTFREGLRTKVKMAIISMLWQTLVEVVELTIMIEKICE
jgi:hypothetical protein